MNDYILDNIIIMSSVIQFLIEGVHINNCLIPLSKASGECDDEINQKLQKTKALFIKDKEIIKKLPTIFENLDTWVSSTRIKCWFCTLNFDTVPLFLPRAIFTEVDTTTDGQQTKKTKTKFSVEGCFHSFECVMAYIDLHYPDIGTYTDKVCLVKMLFKVIFGESILTIPKALPKENMVQYGGDMSVSDYRNSFKYVLRRKSIDVSSKKGRENNIWEESQD